MAWGTRFSVDDHFSGISEEPRVRTREKRIRKMSNDSSPNNLNETKAMKKVKLRLLKRLENSDY